MEGAAFFPSKYFPLRRVFLKVNKLGYIILCGVDEAALSCCNQGSEYLFIFRIDIYRHWIFDIEWLAPPEAVYQESAERMTESVELQQTNGHVLIKPNQTLNTKPDGYMTGSVRYLAFWVRSLMRPGPYLVCKPRF
jgi:hypothetical protein